MYYIAVESAQEAGKVSKALKKEGFYEVDYGWHNKGYILINGKNFFFATAYTDCEYQKTTLEEFIRLKTSAWLFIKARNPLELDSFLLAIKALGFKPHINSSAGHAGIAVNIEKLAYICPVDDERLPHITLDELIRRFTEEAAENFSRKVSLNAEQFAIVRRKTVEIGGVEFSHKAVKEISRTIDKIRDKFKQ